MHSSPGQRIRDYFGKKLNYTLIERVSDLVGKGNYPHVAFSMVGLDPVNGMAQLARGMKLMQKLRKDPYLILTDEQELATTLAICIIEAKAKLESSLLNNVKTSTQDDWRAASWVMGKRAPKRWGSRRDAAPTAQPQTNVKVTVNTGVLAVAAPAQNMVDWESQFRSMSATTETQALDEIKAIPDHVPKETEDVIS